MNTKRFKEILSLGETICIEFKRCGNGVEADVYETYCILRRVHTDRYDDREMTSNLLISSITINSRNNDK